MINAYFEQRTVLKEIWQLVDIRHPPSEQDVQMMEWLDYKKFPRLVVATKADKISRNQRAKNIKLIKEKLGVKDEEIVVFSAQTGEGKEKLLQRIEQLL